MPEFTMVFKTLITDWPGDTRDGLTRDAYVGLDSYPIFDEAYRAGLNQKIIDHFWNQEIGMETIELFRFSMRRKMNEVMPIYNQFYKSQLLTVDPFLTFDTSTNTENISASNATNASTSDSKARAANSEFPQNLLAEHGDYASGAVDNVANTVSTGEADTSDESSGTVNTRGFSGAMSDLLIHYRDTFLNIDMQVIAELQDCFMGLWSNNDETFQHRFYGYPGWY